METHLLEYPLPSCRVNKGLIVKLENYLLMQIPALLKKELSGMMEVLDLKSPASLKKYSVTLLDRTGSRELESITALPDKTFPPSIRKITLDFKVGRPEILAVTLIFAAGARPTLEVATMSRQVKKDCPRIAAGMSGIVRRWGNRNWIFHSRPAQLLLAIAIPAAVAGYGWFRGIEPFFLFSSQGWLLLMAGGLSLTLPRLFPLVSFQTRRRFDFKKLVILGLLALNLAAISAYVGLLVFELDRIRF
jgi:hypothetical protein